MDKLIQKQSTTLDLDAEQQQQLMEIFVSVPRNFASELKINHNGRSRNELRQTLVRIMSYDVDEQIRSILQDSQRKKYVLLKMKINGKNGAAFPT